MKPSASNAEGFLFACMADDSEVSGEKSKESFNHHFFLKNLIPEAIKVLVAKLIMPKGKLDLCRQRKPGEFLKED